MNSKIVNMSIAELIVSSEPVVICTVLGSCVSVCLFSSEARAGGMIHYALPQMANGSEENPLRYGRYAIEQLVQEMIRLTGHPAASLVAKIVGGANNIASENEARNVGAANTALAREMLDQYAIKIVGEEVGGSVGRKILFHVQTGRLQSAFVGPGFSRPSAEKAIRLKRTS